MTHLNQIVKQSSTQTTHLSTVDVQAHVVAVVGGHQVSPGVGSVPLVAVDGGGLHGSVSAEREVEACVFGTSGLHGADAYRPALLTQ